MAKHRKRKAIKAGGAKGSVLADGKIQPQRSPQDTTHHGNKKTKRKKLSGLLKRPGQAGTKRIKKHSHKKAVRKMGRVKKRKRTRAGINGKKRK